MVPYNYNINPDALDILTKASQIQVREAYDTFLLHNRIYEVEVHHGDYFVIELLSYDELFQYYYDLCLFDDVHIVRVSIERISNILNHEYKHFISQQ